MPDVISQFDHLLKDDGPAALVLKQWLKPVGGYVFYPPTYANPSQKKGDPPVYNIDRFDQSKYSVCVIDSIPSQANRIEPAFGRLIDKDGNVVKLVPVAKVKVKIKTDDGDENKAVDLLEAGHRAADAIVRFSNKAPEITKAIKARAAGDSLPMAKTAPTSLIFGMWDSRETGVKIPRLINSIIRAYDVLEHRRSAVFNVPIKYEEAGVIPGKGEKDLSDVGMANALATFQHGGIEARGGICRDASLNLATLRDIFAKNSSDTQKLQRYILGLSLVALTYSDGKTLNLRQGCQLVAVPEKPMTRVLVNADGTESDFQINRDTALAYAKAAADAFVIGDDWTDIVFDPKTAKNALKKPEKVKEGGV